ncbi:hypothetical protein EV643_1152 [Kribbella sp. VKM Ac-2527]|jgi:hypothetical protein|uniref:Uncharacterized protein n=1 Tax=Kribbella caucasensis TaxID=2512215 RepID=A0A4R6K551_9ACTN|nr:hypothetical protein [Kribbella sp. VKM Ac-2527]TDO44506.1 hypothetical protein EV643_1152 [Kribbella sp. VKM Ac-2527]
MTGTLTHFTQERAPCGRLVDGDRSKDDDSEGLKFDDVHWACGCRTIRHEFHDGSVRLRTIRHDGKVLMDEHSGDHEA